MLPVICCVLFVAYCLLFGGCFCFCVLRVACFVSDLCCLLCVVCCVLFVVVVCCFVVVGFDC